MRHSIANASISTGGFLQSRDAGSSTRQVVVSPRCVASVMDDAAALGLDLEKVREMVTA
ncbi:MAG: hypothetical protein VYE46_03010 [Cyanobacteriota bacterium]|nr:hypothetical protein [Cyanobacteriota bacterium]